MRGNILYLWNALRKLSWNKIKNKYNQSPKGYGNYRPWKRDTAYVSLFLFVNGNITEKSKKDLKLVKKTLLYLM